jgi:hypothetical protein
VEGLVTEREDDDLVAVLDGEVAARRQARAREGSSPAIAIGRPREPADLRRRVYAGGLEGRHDVDSPGRFQAPAKCRARTC